MKTFSVMTVSKRTGWEEQLKACIDSQTLLPQAWVIVPESNPPFSLFYDNKSKYIGKIVEPPEQTRLSNLNASENAGLRNITTDYVILLNDFIDLPKDCFEKLMNLVDERTFVCVSPYNADGSSDSRHTGLNEPRSIRPEEWEPMVGAAPMKVYRELGGYDEEYDNGWAWDNVNVAQRAAMLGCKFVIDESNRPRLLPHEQTSKLDMPLNMDRHMKTIRAIREGKKPLRLNYL